MEQKKYVGRGGKREGAGRPKGTFKENKKKPFCFKLSVEEEKAVRELLAKMRGKLVILLCLLSFCLPVSALTLEGGVQYTEETARIEAFKDVPKHNKSYLFSKLFHIGIENEIAKIESFKTNIEGMGNVMALGVTYKKCPNKIFYYYNNKLVGYDISYKNEAYFKKTAKYTTTGKLVTIFLDVSENESYGFNTQGILESHWIDGKDIINGYTRNTIYFAQ